jgi:hypothetical protein
MLRWMSDPEELPPPWAKHPEIPLGSIGWRMGYGESWMMRWGEWLEQQPRDRGWRVAYLRRHPPAPRSWAHTVAGVLEPAREDEEDADEDYEAANERLAKQLAVEGLVGDDVAMGAWEALHGDGPEAPWAAGWHAGKLGSAARYGGRELTFWARWCASRREDGRLDAWLRRVPAPDASWEPMREAVRHGWMPSEWVAGSAWERSAVLVAAHAEAPAPWELGEPPSSLRQEYEDDSSYADAWCSWVYDAFDDGSSWRAYLERHGPVPAEWRETIERVIYIGG